MLDPLKASIAVNLIFMVAIGVLTALAWIYRGDALYWRFRAANSQKQYRIMRRQAIAFRASVPPPTGYKDKLPYWDAYELNRFAEKTA